ncbi:speckle-type POZ protein [Hordeum vulgare]|nr:speckle-type POZ protein [Hordeum vulgare]
MAASESSVTRTASTCAPETVHGTHVFKIDGYSLHRGFGVGKFIQSATFAVGFYPDGYREDSNGWVSVYLEHGAATWGVDKSWTKSELGECIVDDILCIQCNLTVIKFKEAQAEEPRMNVAVRVPPSDLFHNLSSLLEAREGVDVSFSVKGEVFSAHKIILAMRSAVFRAEFYGPMRDEQRRSITVEDMQPAAFRGLLHFIHKDSLPPMYELSDDEDEEMLRHLHVAADRYAMERMKLMCESKLCEVLYAETVATTLALADQHHCSQLKDACIEFMNSSDTMVDVVVASKGYEQLKRECPTIIADIWEKAAKIRKV